MVRSRAMCLEAKSSLRSKLYLCLSNLNTIVASAIKVHKCLVVSPSFPQAASPEWQVLL